VQVPADWLAIIGDRSENILVSHWPAAFWSALAVQLATLAAAAARIGGRSGRLLWAGLAAGLLGLAATWVLGDLAASLLVLQLQLWRILWITVLLANAGLALLALGRDGGEPRGVGGYALPLLVLAHALAGVPVLALAVLAAAGAAALLQWRGRLRPAASAAAALWAVAIAAILAQAAMVAMAALAFAGGRPAGASVPFQVWQAPFDILAMAVLAGLILARGRLDLRPGPALAAAGLLLVLACVLWDQRPPAQRQAEQAGAAPALARALASRPGEVFWVGGDTEPWIWLDRPSWTSSMQGAGVVFSPVLARLTDGRTRRAQEAGLLSPEARTPFRTTPPVPLQPDPARVRRFCAAPDAPAWLVVPDLAPGSPVRRLATAAWRPPVPTFQPTFAGRVLSWRGGRVFFAIPCAPAGR
jgi:hypothetical protein